MNAYCKYCKRGRSHAWIGTENLMCTACRNTRVAPHSKGKVKMRIKKEKQYRLLNAGDRLKSGDAVWVTPEKEVEGVPAAAPYWRDVPSKFSGKVVEPSDPPCRRLL